MRQVHTREPEEHENVSLKNVFAQFSYTTFHMQVNSGKIRDKKIVVCTQTLKNYREHLQEFGLILKVGLLF